jgi:hypothetical protein
MHGLRVTPAMTTSAQENRYLPRISWASRSCSFAPFEAASGFRGTAWFDGFELRRLGL